MHGPLQNPMTNNSTTTTQPKRKGKGRRKEKKNHASFFLPSQQAHKEKKNKVRMIDQSHACNICNANEMVLMVHAWCP